MHNVERHVYLYGPWTQELAQMFISPKIAERSPMAEHIHVDTWAKAADYMIPVLRSRMFVSRVEREELMFCGGRGMTKTF